MLVMLFACRVVSMDSDFTSPKGDSKHIPPALRQKVADVVINTMSAPYLVPTEFGGSLTVN